MRAALAAVLLLTTTTAHALEGQPRIIDGDTIEIAGQHIRLHGIDAPERNQTCGDVACGREATTALAEVIGGRPVACEATNRDRYGRMVAVCRARGLDLNAELVAAGWALACRWYSTDYVDEEAAARTAGRGMWEGSSCPQRSGGVG